jgi:dihydroxyacetone kinase-like protein
VFSVAQAVAWVRATAAVVEEHAAELTKLDSAIGDGDHGTNMNRGFKAAVQRLDGLEGDQDFGSVFKAVGMALIGKVGGASGPLYGSLFLGMGKELGDAAEVEDERLAAACGPATTAWSPGARPSSRTRPCWTPGTRPSRPSTPPWPRARSWARPWTRPAAAAEAGMKATIPMIARKGPGQLPRRALPRPPGPGRHLDPPDPPDPGRRRQRSLIERSPAIW